MKLIVYDDHPDFGGHQIMACRGVQALLDRPDLEVVFFHHPENRRLLNELLQDPKLTRTPSPCITRRLQGLRNRMSPGATRLLSRRFMELGADRVLCIQGDPEGASRGVMAARKSGIPCISYLAIPHTLAEMGAAFGHLRDRWTEYLIDLPDRYIVISQGMKHKLLARGAKQPITIVPNGIPMPPEAQKKANEVRPFTVGLLGRIEFGQKQQDLMIRAWTGHPERFGDSRLLIAGDGPDRNRLQQLIAGRADISLRPWQKGPDTFFEQIDLLVIPSRFEGVPLVMLEALVRGIPVAASRCDGMAELLPEEWTFEHGNAEACAAVVASLQHADPQKREALRKKVRDEHDPGLFKTRFIKAVLD